MCGHLLLNVAPSIDQWFYNHSAQAGANALEPHVRSTHQRWPNVQLSQRRPCTAAPPACYPCLVDAQLDAAPDQITSDRARPQLRSQRARLLQQGHQLALGVEGEHTRAVVAAADKGACEFLGRNRVRGGVVSGSGLRGATAAKAAESTTHGAAVQVHQALRMRAVTHEFVTKSAAHPRSR